MNRQQRRAAARVAGVASQDLLAVQTLMSQGFAHHEAGRLEEAKPCYREVLTLAPNQGDALYYLGLAILQGGKPADAIAPLRRALKGREDFAEGHFNLGVALQDSGDTKAAATSFEAAIRHQPDLVDAYVNVGLAYEDLGRLDDAITAFQDAVRLDPDRDEAYLNLGNVLRKKGEAEIALEALDYLLERRPNYPEAHNNRGLALTDLRRFDEGLEAFIHAVEQRSGYVDAFNNGGVCLRMAGRLDDALDMFASALKIDPDYLDAVRNYTRTAVDLAQFSRAEASARYAIKLAPTEARSHIDLAQVLRFSDRPDEAIEALKAAIEIEPENTEAHNETGTIHWTNNRFDEALEYYKKALKIEPNNYSVYSNMGLVLCGAGRVAEGVECYRKALDLNATNASALSNYLYGLSYLEGLSLEDMARENARFGAVYDRFDPDAPFDNDRTSDRRLKIGYVSPDFKVHVTSRFIEGVLGAHDKERFEIYCYAQVESPDQMTEQLKSFADHWRSIVGVTDDAVADQIRADGIDILIDLAGHTGRNRLPMFGLKPAPIQMSWIGYPGSTGLKAMDYLATMGSFIPPAARKFYSERIFDLPRLSACYLPPANVPDPAPTPCLATGSVTFGCFNNPNKVGPTVIALWSEILKAVPGSTLLYKARLFDNNPDSQERTLAAFESHGVDRSRIVLEGPSAHAEYLQSYGRIDVALDPFPYNGGTTTMETLLMGVPMIALRGDRFASLVGVGMLELCGLNELVADTMDDYVRIAAELATRPDRLVDLRNRIRPAFLGSGISDVGAFTRDIEESFRVMWQRWCAKPAEASEPAAEA